MTGTTTCSSKESMSGAKTVQDQQRVLSHSNIVLKELWIYLAEARQFW